ncbi:hypothetical protein [Flavobacterium terrisoli]|uniref:hypothetical protein n=1 Tax=Flavobacterium terrisoli TaxID=3242195 RepID=UPI002543EEFF|nr:hypothetical protein [Flavobacterium buctense]
MKNILCCAFFFLMTSISFAQDAFEKGYYINSKGVKVEGYLQIVNFENINATEKLTFKKDLKEEVVKLSTDEIVEFGVGEELKFQKATFQMDDMSFHKDFTYQKELQLKTVTLFLNVLIEGEATLYSYDGGNDLKYFYSLKSKGSSISQLTYKKYISGETIKENNDYKETLFKEVKCESQTFNEYVSLKYEKEKLLPIFEKFNKCNNSDFKVYKNKFEKKVDINIIAMVGVNRFDSEFFGFGFGGEFEVVTPSEKLSFFGKLKFESVNAEFRDSHYSAMDFNLNENIYDANYKAFDLIFGIRYTFKINNNHKIFVSGAGGVNSPKVTGTLIKRVTNGSGSYETKYNINYSEIDFFPSLGLGYLYKGKYGIDLEFDIQKTVFRELGYDFTVKYNKIGLNLRYIFN